MYCRQCGKTVVSKGKYCEFCGATLDLDGVSAMPEISLGTKNSAADIPMQKKHGMGCIKALLFLLAAVLVALVLAAALKIFGG